jgi:hypothetical protein
MSQIPTYVTAVPNGTEKVSLNRSNQPETILTKKK